MAKRPVTLRDVALKAGVHSSTVSRVLNPKTRDMVSRELTLKVTKAAEALVYHMNPFARSLKTNRSCTIGVLIPDLTDPLFPPIIRGIESALIQSGYTAILANSDNDPERERSSLQAMKARKVDGLILATAHRSDKLVQQCLSEGIPLVLINRLLDNHAVPSVINDDASGVRMAVDHVAELGHRRIAHVAGPQNLSTGYGRLTGFVTAMRARGLDADDDAIAIADTFTESAGRQAAFRLLQGGRDFTAIVTAGDMMALGCYDAIAELGIRCPDDISITGFNDVPFADKFSPPLTSLRIPHGEMGVEAARLLLRMLEHGDVGDITIVLKPKLVVRKSTAAPPRKRRGPGSPRLVP